MWECPSIPQETVAYSARTDAGSCRWCQTNCVCKNTMQHLEGWQNPTAQRQRVRFDQRDRHLTTRVSRFPGTCSKIHPSHPAWQSKKSHFATLHQAISPTVTQLGLPDRMNLWHPPMASSPFFKYITFSSLKKKEHTRNRQTELHMQFTVDEGRIWDSKWFHWF